MVRLALMTVVLLVLACDGESGTVDVGTDGPRIDVALLDGAQDSGGEEVSGDLVQLDGKGSPHWDVQTGNLGRVDHSATLLKDGRVLVVGGWNRDNNKTTRLASASIYDPLAKTLTPTGDLGTARSGHTASLLPDGRVLVVGGIDDTSKYLASSEIYDVAKGSWSAGPSLPSSVAGHRAVTLQSGDVLVVGGHGGSGPSAALAQYQAATWKLLAASLNHKRAGHTTTLLQSGKVLVAGGYDGTQAAYLDSIEVYDPTAGTVTLLSTKLTQERSVHSATLLGSGKVLLVGGVCGSGCSMTGDELYDPATSTINTVTHPFTPPTGHSATLLLDGQVLVAGSDVNSDAQKTVAYDPLGGGSWTVLPPMNHGRHDHTATRLQDGSVLVVGGKTGSWEPITEQLERYYPY